MTDAASPARQVRTVSDDVASVLRDSMSAAAAHAGMPRAILVWEDADESLLEVAQWDGTTLVATREPPASILPVVSSEMADLDFLAIHAARADARIVRLPAGATEQVSSAPINPAFASRFGFAHVIAVRVRGDRVNGRLLFPVAASARRTALPRAAEAAGILATTLDRALPDRRVRSGALLEERQRLSHELHDGVLQSLTGIAFRLKTAESLLSTDAAAAQAMLREAQELLVEEQREVRMFVMGLREIETAGSIGALRERLPRLMQRVEAVWGVSVQCDVAIGDVTVTPRREHEILQIVREAIVNGVRHGGATNADVRVRREGGSIRVTVRDDGQGFAFRGRYDLAELQERRLGPVTLKARVQALQGALEIDSTDRGATIDIRLSLTSSGDGSP